MTHLSSCYFCGATLDESLQTCELPTPEADGTTTVTLCSSCLEKLTVVLEATGDGSLVVNSEEHQTPDTEREDSPGVVGQEEQESTQASGFEHAPAEMEESDAVAETDESPGGEDTEDDADASVGETPSPDERETEPDSTDESPSDVEAGTAETDESDTTTDGETMDTVVSDDPLSEEDDPFSADAFDDDVDVDIEEQVDETLDEDDVLSEGDSLAAESDDENVETAEFGENIAEAPTQDEEGGESTAMSAEGHSEESDSVQPEETEQDNDGTVGGPADETNVAEGDGEETEASERPPEQRTSQGGADDAKDKSSGDSEDEETAAKTTISALEYNKVMRMLQNRDFPVNRDEIELVAANAYDLAQSECAQVIDLAVDRGLLDEREGQLHRPEE